MLKKYSLVIATLFLTTLFVKLNINYTKSFNELDDNIIVDITTADSAKIREVLISQNCVENEGDARLIAGFISGKTKNGESFSTLYDFNKRAWQIPVKLIDSIGVKLNALYFISEADSSRLRLGQDEVFEKLDTDKLSNTINLNSGNGKIRVYIKEDPGKLNILAKLFKKDIPCANVVVRLSEQYIDSIKYVSKRRTKAFAKTDENGECLFEGLNETLSYSVIPIKIGAEFGTAKGTIGGNLANCSNKKDIKKKGLSFTQQEHRIRIFDAPTLKQIKEDRTLTIRSKQEYKKTLTTYVILFFTAWWGLWLFSRRKNRRIDIGLLSLIMTLTGICLLTMFSLNDPLTDKLLGVDMAQGIIAGVICIGLLQMVDFKRLYQNQLKIGFDIPLEIIKWSFKPYRSKVSYLTAYITIRSNNVFLKIGAVLLIFLCTPFLLLDLFRTTKLNNIISKALDKLPKGSGYLLTALLLTALLFTPLGAEVGGMKVNLNIGILFQPSEIAKYLIVVFMAGFFSINADRIVQYSEKGNAELFVSKLKMMTIILLGLGILMGIYLILGDMGPALVLAFTFIILYSIIKSKVDIEGLKLSEQLKKILSCDLAMLLYGVSSFVIFLYIGHKMHTMAVFCSLWFIIWLIIGSTKKQIFETPILFNFIIAAFIYGGSILGGKTFGKFSKCASVAERLDERIQMCTNTWGTLPSNGIEAIAGQNNQVAEGLWGLASGGITGQGFGNGTPHFIPAFHTDMILESIGEQMGFIGLLIIFLLLAILLRKTIVLGYRSTHPFLFYLCAGIAIVTAVQFIIISLGSTGIIPLTGVTVPFLSYGKVSMILNIIAFGIILSITSHYNEDIVDIETERLIKRNIGKYNYTVSILSWTYCVIAIFICSVFLKYQFLSRNETLIKPVYVNNENGIPVVQYNPRIDQLIDKMFIGDIYDRNGILLATSDKAKIIDYNKFYKIAFEDNSFEVDTRKKQSRYYPFGQHLAYMLGDNNSSLFTFHSESTGYTAEVRHFSELRGYNRRLDKNGNELGKPILYSKDRKIDKWHSISADFKDTIQVPLYNYTALIPYLKKGINSKRIDNYNKRDESLLSLGKIKPKDIHLTLDAILQTKIQIGLENIINDEISTNLDSKTQKIRNIFHNPANSISKNLDLLRVSVVILDANKGDLLASANYPLPSPDRLNNEIVKDKIPPYNDWFKPNGWKSYSDLDLGLLYSTAPGSTAKVMSALAGLRKIGTKSAEDKQYSYKVLASQKVGDEPPNTHFNPRNGMIDMRNAIVWSSNCYFINLVNDNDLYNDLAFIYRTVGTQIVGDRPYGLLYSDSTNVTEFRKTISAQPINEALKSYRNYVDQKKTGPMQDNIIWQWAWGQGDLTATPLSIARVAATIANDGVFVPTKYTIDENDNQLKPITVVSKKEAEKLGEFMKEEAVKHVSSALFSQSDNVGGKTGTAQRKKKNNITKKEVKVTDGWYMFFIQPNDRQHHSDLAIAIRIEHGQSSTFAKILARDLIVNMLQTDEAFLDYGFNTTVR